MKQSRTLSRAISGFRAGGVHLPQEEIRFEVGNDVKLEGNHSCWSLSIEKQELLLLDPEFGAPSQVVGEVPGEDGGFLLRGFLKDWRPTGRKENSDQLKWKARYFTQGHLGSSFLEERLESEFERDRDREKVLIRPTASLNQLKSSVEL